MHYTVVRKLKNRLKLRSFLATPYTKDEKFMIPKLKSLKNFLKHDFGGIFHNYAHMRRDEL